MGLGHLVTGFFLLGCFGNASALGLKLPLAVRACQLALAAVVCFYLVWFTKPALDCATKTRKLTLDDVPVANAAAVDNEGMSMVPSEEEIRDATRQLKSNSCEPPLQQNVESL